MSKNIILFDPQSRTSLLPLAFTRPVADFRFGIMTIREKWENAIEGQYSYLTQDYLKVKYPTIESEDNILIAGNVCPTELLASEVNALNVGEALFYNDKLIAFRGDMTSFANVDNYKVINTAEVTVLSFDKLHDLFMLNGKAMELDYAKLTDGRTSQPLSSTVTVLGDASSIFIEKGASVECAILNVKNGPIYIGKDVDVQEGSLIRGPFSACEHSAVNMGAKIYGPTTLGPYVKVGGELNNVIFFGYANKAHDGFLGNAVIGEWCNLGAGSNASNLKNDYSEAKQWDYATRRFGRTGLQFCGLVMGDHSKVGINSMLNTATVLGVGVNIYGSGFPRNFVSSFNEGGTAGYAKVGLKKFFTTASIVMGRRSKELTEADKAIYEHLYNQD